MSYQPGMECPMFKDIGLVLLEFRIRHGVTLLEKGILFHFGNFETHIQIHHSNPVLCPVFIF
jgi:hypothetical protein